MKKLLYLLFFTLIPDIFAESYIQFVNKGNNEMQVSTNFTQENITIAKKKTSKLISIKEIITTPLTIEVKCEGNKYQFQSKIIDLKKDQILQVLLKYNPDADYPLKIKLNICDKKSNTFSAKPKLQICRKFSDWQRFVNPVLEFHNYTGQTFTKCAFHIQGEETDHSFNFGKNNKTIKALQPGTIIDGTMLFLGKTMNQTFNRFIWSQKTALKNSMKTQIRYQKNLEGFFQRLLGDDGFEQIEWQYPSQRDYITRY